MAARVGAGGGTGRARRRRERRFRSLLRHERMAVAMAPAESLSTTAHSTRRRQGPREARSVLHGHVPEAPLPQGSRPPCLGEPRNPQDKVQQRAMVQLADDVPMLSLLASPVPQMWTSWWQCLLATIRRLPTRLPKVQSFVRRRWWNSWFEVPTVFSSSILPSRSLTFQFLVVVLVREVYKVLTQDRVQQRRLWSRSLTSPFVEAFQVFFPRQRSSQRTVEQLVDIPVPGGGLHVPLPDPGASASSAVSPFFRTFPWVKKSAKVGARSRSELAAHSSSSTLGA